MSNKHTIYLIVALRDFPKNKYFTRCAYPVLLNGNNGRKTNRFPILSYCI